MFKLEEFPNFNQGKGAIHFVAYCYMLLTG